LRSVGFKKEWLGCLF